MAVSDDYVRSVLRRAKVRGVISPSDLESILDDEPNLTGDDIEDIVVLLADMGIKIGPTQEQVEREEAEFLRSTRAGLWSRAQLTGEGWLMLFRAAERENAALQKSKQAAIEKYGAVLVHAAERWARPRHPEVAYYLGKADPYEWFIRMYRGAYRRAMWQPAPRRRSEGPATKPPIPLLLRAVERMHDAPSRPFVGAYLLEARRD
jgi:hypothetical protein